MAKCTKEDVERSLHSYLDRMQYSPDSFSPPVGSAFDYWERARKHMTRMLSFRSIPQGALMQMIEVMYCIFQATYQQEQEKK